MIASLLGLAACSSPPQVLGIGPSTYAINVYRSGGASAGIADAIQSADAFCAQYDRVMMLESSGQGGSGAYDDAGNTYFGMTFSCLLLDDPALKAPSDAARAGLLPPRNDNYTLGLDMQGADLHGPDMHAAADMLAIAHASPDPGKPDELKTQTKD